MIGLRRLDSTLFTWELLCAGSISEIFDIKQRTLNISLPKNKNVLRKYADGYCYGHELSCRVKPDEVAVMFCFDNWYFWTHFRLNEFKEVFGGAI